MKSEKFIIRKPGIALSLLGLGFVVMLSFANAWAYSPPIGIPDPGMWGETHPIDSSAPSTAVKCPAWPSAQTTGCYYINMSDVNATDTNNTYGYPGKPRVTIPTNTYPAGSYVEIHGGTYTGTKNLNFAGTANNPCWFRGTATNLPLISGVINLNNSTYLFAEYLEFNGGSGGCMTIYGTASDHVAIRNSKFQNRTWVSNTSAIGVTPSQGGIIHDIVLYKNDFSELGDWQTTLDQDFHGINPNGYGRTPPTELHHVWILDSTFYHISGDAVQVNGGTAAMVPYLHHIYMGKNISHTLRQAHFWTKQASHIIMSQNIGYDNVQHGPQTGTCMGYQYNPDNVWIIFNDCYDSSNGIKQSDTATDLTHNTYIIGNKIHNIHPAEGEAYNPEDYWKTGQAIALWQGGENRHIINNTIYDVSGGISLVYEGPAEISGNIISNINSLDYHVSNQNARLVTTMKTNLLYSSSGKARFNWGGAWNSLASFQTAIGQCMDCVEKDPLFVDAAKNNFAVTPSSPAVAAGTRNAAYDLFKSLYGISIAYDFNGNPRPSTGGWTIGAFEPSTGATTVLPAPHFQEIIIK